MTETGDGYFHKKFYEDERLKDLRSCLKPNPFELRRKDRSFILPSSGVFLTAVFDVTHTYDGVVYGGGVVTTYPYDKVQNYNFLPPERIILQVRFGQFDRSKQFEMEYLDSGDMRKGDRHRYENFDPNSASYLRHGWINKETVKTPSAGKLVVRSGPKAIMSEHDQSFEDNENVNFSLFRLLSYFEASDKKGVADLIVAVFDKGMNLPKDDVSIIAEQVDKHLVV